MVKIEFKEVGRDKKSWTAEIPELHCDYLNRQVRGSGAIRSHYPDFEMVDDDNGVIIAGMRVVGKFTVSDIK